VSARHRRTGRDTRRRALGQNFLVDHALIRRLVDGLDITADDLIVDIGAGTGALTLPIAALGVTVWAVEPDPAWADALEQSVTRASLGDRVRVVRTDIEHLRLPRAPYRVVANPPFGSTTRVLSTLFDDPRRGPARADLVLQREVALKHATTPPRALRTAAWAPWWHFRVGATIDRTSFRPRPSVDAAVLTVTRRSPPLLPTHLARDFVETLRPAWAPSPPERIRP
jgi:23S rRNA (adenine-N6)-dimethyltransferase